MRIHRSGPWGTFAGVRRAFLAIRASQLPLGFHDGLCAIPRGGWMSFVLAAPDMLATAATDAAQVGSAVMAGNLAAAIPTTEVAAAGADEISAAIAALFGAHARQYQ